MEKLTAGQLAKKANVNVETIRITNAGAFCRGPCEPEAAIASTLTKRFSEYGS